MGVLVFSVSFLICSVLLGVFLWFPLGVFGALFLRLFFLGRYAYEVVFSLRERYVFSFMIFLLREALIFASLFVSVGWYEGDEVVSISS